MHKKAGQKTGFFSSRRRVQLTKKTAGQTTGCFLSYFTSFATSAARSSWRFSMPSPFSKRV